MAMFKHVTCMVRSVEMKRGANLRVTQLIHTGIQYKIYYHTRVRTTTEAPSLIDPSQNRASQYTDRNWRFTEKFFRFSNIITAFWQTGHLWIGMWWPSLEHSFKKTLQDRGHVINFNFDRYHTATCNPTSFTQMFKNFVFLFFLFIHFVNNVGKKRDLPIAEIFTSLASWPWMTMSVMMSMVTICCCTLSSRNK